MGLTPNELAQIRADINELLPDTCYILSVTRTSDGAGGWSESWGTAGTATCRLDFANPGKESDASLSLKPFKVGILTLPYDTTITTANRVQHNSIQYNVTGINDNQSWIGAKQANVEKIP